MKKKNYLGILKMDLIKQIEIKEEKIEKNISEQGKYYKIKSGGETYSKSIVRYSGSFLNWIREKQRNCDDKTRKLMTIHKWCP